MIALKTGNGFGYFDGNLRNCLDFYSYFCRAVDVVR